MKRRGLAVLATLLQVSGAVLAMTTIGLAAWWQWSVAKWSDDRLVWLIFGLLAGLAAIAVGRSLQIRMETATKRASLRESLTNTLNEAAASESDDS